MVLDQLWKMGSHFKIQGSHHKSKKEMADTLVQYCGKVGRKIAIGTIDTNVQLIRINIKRYLNVLISEKTKPLLAERGATLSKQQL